VHFWDVKQLYLGLYRLAGGAESI